MASRKIQKALAAFSGGVMQVAMAQHKENAAMAREARLQEAQTRRDDKLRAQKQEDTLAAEARQEDKEKRMVKVREESEIRIAKERSKLKGQDLTAAERKVNAMVEAGYVPDAKAGWAVVLGSGKDVSNKEFDLAIEMMRDQRAADIRPDSEEYQSMENMLERVRAMRGDRTESAAAARFGATPEEMEGLPDAPTEVPPAADPVALLEQALGERETKEEKVQFLLDLLRKKTKKAQSVHSFAREKLNELEPKYKFNPVE